jgi:hypothetical protein
LYYVRPKIKFHIANLEEPMPDEFIRPKQAAMAAATHSQQVYDAIRNRRLRAQRRAGKIFIERASFERWKAALETRRRLLLEGRLEGVLERARV